MTRTAIRVIKVGGSLLDDDRLGGNLGQWLDHQSVAHHLLVTGGGPFANLVRQADRRYHLGQATAHWLAVRTMRITARMLAQILPEATLVVGDRPIPDPVVPGRVTVFDPWSFLRGAEPHLAGTRLPGSWDVTSDSIAARVAIAVQADELVLLKSALPPHADIEKLAADGYVDRFFSALAGELPAVRAVDFRTRSRSGKRSWREVVFKAAKRPPRPGITQS